MFKVNRWQHLHKANAAGKTAGVAIAMSGKKKHY